MASLLPIRADERIHNCVRGRGGVLFSSVDILEAALRSGVARTRPDGVVVWLRGEAGPNIARDYLLAIRREEREFMALVSEACDLIPEPVAAGAEDSHANAS